MSTYVTWYLVRVPSKGVSLICKTEAERDKAVSDLCRKCVEDEQWRVDKPGIVIYVDRHSKTGTMTGRYGY